MALFCQAATRREAGADRLRRKSPKPDIGGPDRSQVRSQQGYGWAIGLRRKSPL